MKEYKITIRRIPDNVFLGWVGYCPLFDFKLVEYLHQGLRVDELNKEDKIKEIEQIINKDRNKVGIDVDVQVEAVLVREGGEGNG